MDKIIQKKRFTTKRMLLIAGVIVFVAVVAYGYNLSLNKVFKADSDKVTISSMNATAPNFDAYNFKRYLRAKRILKTGMVGVSTLKSDKVY